METHDMREAGLIHGPIWKAFYFITQLFALPFAIAMLCISLTSVAIAWLGLPVFVIGFVLKVFGITDWPWTSIFAILGATAIAWIVMLMFASLRDD
jgi:hypothetical protein